MWRFGLAIAVVAACGGNTDTSPRRDAGATSFDPARAQIVLRDWLAALESGDKAAAGALYADDATETTADPVEQAVTHGKARVLALWGRRKGMHCVPQLTLVAGRDITTLILCDGTAHVKKPPTERHARSYSMLELHLDDRGLLDRSILWNDLIRRVRQLGVDIDADATFDTPWPAPVVATTRPDATEAANAATARAMIAALDRRDAAALAQYVAPGLAVHGTDRAEPRVYATPNDFADTWSTALASCKSSAYLARTTTTAGAWVALRFGRSCILAADLPGVPGSAGRESFLSNLWLMRFDGGKVAEIWSADTRYSEWLQTGKLRNHELVERMIAAGLR